MDTVTLSMHDVMERVKVNPVAYDEIKRAKSNYSAAGILGFTGALLVSVPLVTVAAGGHPEWSLAVVGGTLILVSIPLNLAFQRHAVMRWRNIINNLSHRGSRQTSTLRGQGRNGFTVLDW